MLVCNNIIVIIITIIQTGLVQVKRGLVKHVCVHVCVRLCTWLVRLQHWSWLVLQGVGGSAVGGMRVKSGEISSIDLSSHQFHKIKCLFTDSDGLDHTLYSSGILCGDLMSRCTVILDYARARIMFVPDDATGSDRY